MKATIKKKLEALERTVLERENTESDWDIIVLWLDFVNLMIDRPHLENRIPNVTDFKDFKTNQKARELVREFIDERIKT